VLVAIENELRIGLQKLRSDQLVCLRFEFQFADDAEECVGVVAGLPVAFAVGEPLPSLDDVLGYSRSTLCISSAVRVHDGCLPVERHEHSGLLAGICARRVIRFPFATTMKPSSTGVDDPRREEQGHQHVIVAFGDMAVNQLADDDCAHRAVKDKSADEQDRK
jgi:hypothetical protein